MIKFHELIRLFCGFAMVEFCRFFYYLQYNRGPSYSQLTPSAPSLSAQQRNLLNVRGSSQYPGLYQIGNQNLYLSGNQVWQQDQGGNYYLQPLGTNTRFKRYSGDVTGFISSGEDNAKTYEPSMAYLSALQTQRTPYKPFAASPAPVNVLGYKPGLISSVYTPATSSTPAAVGGTSYGAGRFLGGDGLLGSAISFSPSTSTGK